MPDEFDVFALDANEFRDFDGDGAGDNTDTDDDNDGVLDSVDTSPLDAFPDNPDYSVLLPLDSTSITKNFVLIKPIDKIDPDLSITESGALIQYLEDGSYNVFTVSETTNVKGTWSIEGGRLVNKEVDLVGQINTRQGLFVESSNSSVPAGWSNVNLLHWNANYDEDSTCHTCFGNALPANFKPLTMRVSNSSVLELVEKVGSRMVFCTDDDRTYLENPEYLIDPGLPVSSVVTKKILHYDDGSATLPFTADEIVGQWALPIVPDFVLSDSDLDGEQDDPAGQLLDGVATFNSDLTGKLARSQRQFTH